MPIVLLCLRLCDACYCFYPRKDDLVFNLNLLVYMSTDLNYCTFINTPTPSLASAMEKIALWSPHYVLDCCIIFVSLLFPLSCLTAVLDGKGHRRMSGIMSRFLGCGILSANYWASHCHWYSTCASFCYRHHCHCLLPQLFWIVIPWPLGLLLWFGSFFLIWLVEWWLMALGCRRLVLSGLLDFQGGPGVPLVI